jgi:5-methylcytosine-specific restriction endonuclease McrA
VSVTLGAPTRTSGCHVRGPLPDPGCTPGARFAGATRTAICQAGYSRSVRNVPRAVKDAVYRAYGIRRHFNGADGEVDHLVSLELGGSNIAANLFPEAATPRPGSHEKDRLENALHDEVCLGRLELSRAQRLIAVDWLAAYHARFG